jgi:predicted O-linked N-acetylglucosamine transferase (SPINDLY family)
LATLNKALTASPGHVEALYLRGRVLARLERHEEALQSFDAALATRPDHVGALRRKADTLLAQKRSEEALAAYDEALLQRPTLVAALDGRGVALLGLGRQADAIASFDRALAIAPRFARAYYHRGMALAALGRYDDALGSYGRALEIAPGLVEAWNNHGTTLAKLSREEEALASYNRALALDSCHVRALYNRGNAYQALRRYAEAAADFERVIAFDGDFEYALGSALYCRARLCDWTGGNEVVRRGIEKVRSGHRAIRPFPFLSISDSPEDQLTCARIFVRDRRPAVPPMWRGERYAHKRIKVAYLSADFHSHATAYLMAGLFERHDRERFETVAVSFGPDSRSAMRARLRRAFEHFLDVRRKSDREIAALLRDLKVDIAVDLKGFTTDNRSGIFAHRPAPIQVNYLGYPGTMGAPDIDYILADRVVLPPEHHPFYAEKVVYLPDCYQVNDCDRQIAERTPTRAEAGLPEQGFVFCSFNNGYKINPAMFDVWMRLLSQVTGSVLWLLKGSEAMVENLRHEARERGVAPQRLVFAEHAKLPEHLARHRLAGLFLDTVPYNAHTTASDALWAGVPVLTCMGNTFAGRVAASLLHAIAMPELITRSLADYEALALKLAGEPGCLANIKSKLWRNRLTTPLFDTTRFASRLERAYSMMWETYQSGRGPASFSVTT